MSQSKAAYGKVAAPARTSAVSEQQWELFPYLAGFMILVTMVSIFHVWSRAKVIELNLKIAEDNRAYNEQLQENKQLKVEGASLRTPGRIEALAKGELGMTLPTEQQVVLVR
jgi:cell division protein FtsL